MDWAGCEDCPESACKYWLATQPVWPAAVLICDQDPLSFTTVTFELRGKFVTTDALVLAEERTFNELALTTADLDDVDPESLAGAEEAEPACRY